MIAWFACLHSLPLELALRNNVSFSFQDKKNSSGKTTKPTKASKTKEACVVIASGEPSNAANFEEEEVNLLFF